MSDVARSEPRGDGCRADPLGTLSALAPITLDEANDTAEALTRVDRKYLVDAQVVTALLDRHGHDLAVLEIDDRRSFCYHSRYFDTVDFALHRAAATKRRRRFKVRTRTYESGLVMLEVKAKDGRGYTVKHRTEHTTSADALDRAARAFVASTTGAVGLVERLVPSLTTDYTRTTVVDIAHAARATIDRRLVCTDVDGRTVGSGSLVVETKSGVAASPLDRWLWSHGVRPVRVSKYCTALALLHPDLPGNAWHRTIATHFHSPA